MVLEPILNSEKPQACTAILIGLFLLLIMLSGCMHRQFASEPYPSWGREEHIIQPDNNGLLILRILSTPEPSRASACLLLVHGMNEHIGRYGEVAHYFAQQFIVVGFDFYAHGLSNPIMRQANQSLISHEGRQEVSNAYLAQSLLDNLEPLRKNLDEAIRRTVVLCDEKGSSDRPIFIVSHSLGALVSASYLVQTKQEDDLINRIKGVIFLAPAFAVSQPPGWRGWLANPLIKLSFHAETNFLHPQDEPLPLLIFNQLLSLITVPLLDGMFELLSWPGLRNFLTPVAPDWVMDYLTDSEEEKMRLRADGWIIRRSLLRYVKGIEQEIVQFRRQMKEFRVPYYLLYSEHDPITPSWGSRDFARVTLHHHLDSEAIELPDMLYHQHLFLKEPMRTELLKNLERWINRRLQSLE